MLGPFLFYICAFWMDISYKKAQHMPESFDFKKHCSHIALEA